MTGTTCRNAGGFLDDDDDEAISEDEFADQERLANMTELEREMELAERAERQQQKRQRAELLKAAKSSQQKEAGPRRSGREVREENKKKSAIEELKAARERKARGEKAVVQVMDEEEEEEEHDDDDLELEEGVYDEMVTEDDDIDMDEGVGDEEEASYQDVKGVQVRRYKLEEWFNKPFFEKTLPGCMVRLAAGNKKTPTGETVYDDEYGKRPVVQYMAAKVVGLVEKEPGYYKYLNQSAAPWKSPYPFGPKGERTSLWLKVIRGNSEKIWPLAQVSNSSITEQEFYRYHQQCEENRVPQITRGQVEKVRKRLVAAENYVYSEQDVSKILEKKRAKRNIAMEKAKLERERDAAMQRGENDLVAELDAQIGELQSNMNKKSNKKDTLAELNKKNANINFKTTIMADQQQEEASGADTLDPFRRRATRPIVYWNTSNPNANDDVEEINNDDRNVQDTAVVEPDDDGNDLLKTCVALLSERKKRDHHSHSNASLCRLFNPNSDRRRKLASRKFLSDGLSYYSIEEFERHGRFSSSSYSARKR